MHNNYAKSMIIQTFLVSAVYTSCTYYKELQCISLGKKYDLYSRKYGNYIKYPLPLTTMSGFLWLLDLSYSCCRRDDVGCLME